MSYEFNEGDQVVIIDLEGRRFIGEIISYDVDDNMYWVSVDGFGDNAIGVPANSGRILPYIELGDDGEELVAPPFGMSSEDLARYVGEFIARTTRRVVGVGKDQYDEGSFQKFEGMSIPELLDMLQEELQDVAVYAAMTDILIQRYRNALGKGL